jgi:hypothetical protein
MAVTIKNTNENYGDQVIYRAKTIEQAVAEMQRGVRQCGDDYASVTVSECDYEIVEECDDYRYEPGHLYEFTPNAMGDAYVHCYACHPSLSMQQAIDAYESSL